MPENRASRNFVFPPLLAMKKGIILQRMIPRSRQGGRETTVQIGNARSNTDSSAMMPGRVLPSSHSRNAPPAVEI